MNTTLTNISIDAFQVSAPIKVVEIAEALGLKVWESSLPPGVSGKLFRADSPTGGPSGYAIYVNASDPLVRKRFTVAHEIGHFMLHRSELENGTIEDDTFYRSRLSNRLEAEANRAAADILMPWHLIDKLTQDGLREPLQLAKALGVSETAMKIRLGLPT